LKIANDNMELIKTMRNMLEIIDKDLTMRKKELLSEKIRILPNFRKEIGEAIKENARFKETNTNNLKERFTGPFAFK